MNLLGVLLKTLLADKAVAALGKKTGLSAAQLKKLLPLALLIKFMTNNASTQSGALSLLGALGQHNSEKAMDLQLEEADETDGAKIIGHILGQDKDGAVGELAKDSGLTEAEVSKALGGMAPAVLSTLSSVMGSGKVDLSDGLDLSDVMGLLGGAKPAAGNSLLGSLLGGKPASGGLLGSLLGGGKTEGELDGTALLQLLNASKG